MSFLSVMKIRTWVNFLDRGRRSFFKMGQPRPFSFIFDLFKQTIQFLQQINGKNVHPVCRAGIQTHDL